MEGLAVVVMLISGAAAGASLALARRRALPIEREASRPSREEMAASLAYHVLAAGGEADRAAAEVREISSAVIRRVNPDGWGAEYVRVAGREAAASLLESVVALLVARRSALSDAHYFALLDLCFSLGFYTDTITRLMRERGLERDVDRPLIRERRIARAAALRLLSLRGQPSREEIVAAYRRAARASHPDRFPGATAAERAAAAERFIVVAGAAEVLLREQD